MWQRKETGAAILPPPAPAAIKRNSMETAAGESALKKNKGITGSSSGKAPMPMSSIVSPPTFSATAKAGKFVLVITFGPTKRFKSSVKGTGGKSDVSKKPDTKKGNFVIKPPFYGAPESDVSSSEAGFGHLATSKENTKIATFVFGIYSFTAAGACSVPSRCSVVYESLRGLIVLEGNNEVCELANVVTIAEREAEIAWLKKFVEKKPFKEMARLRLGREEDEKEVHGETTVKQEFAQRLASQQKKFDERLAALDAYLKKIDREHEEIALAMSDVGLEAGFVHGKKGTYINSIPAYDPNVAEVYIDSINVLNDFLSTSSAGGGANQFIVAPSVPYVRDASATTKEFATTEEVKVVDSDVNVLTRTIPDPDALFSTAFASGASASAASVPHVQDQNPFQ
ncbi:hypothetical protein Tco_0771796 [Tanacetum coccineum]|uniref:Uncharacterized protein n=1 Tax=Tanacetum coccineum TaxID=301880 RepID=A0ABQ4ZGE2_9ASTR